MHYFFEPGLDPSRPELTGTEAHHAIRVLRLRPGTLIGITDGRGKRAKGAISPLPDGSCLLLDFKIENIPQPIPIHIGIGILHDVDRMEWMVEKLTETGVTSISFLEMERSERRGIRKDRLDKVAIRALKQSGGSWMPEIKGPVKTKEWMIPLPAGNRFVGYMPSSSPPHLLRLAQPSLPSAIWIGPEGDLTDAEFQLAIESDFKAVSLGPSTLRAETAAINACLILQLVNLPT